MIIAVGFAVVVLLSYAQRLYNSEKEQSDYFRLVSISIALVLAIINIVLAYVFKRFAVYEKYTTNTEYNISCA